MAKIPAAMFEPDKSRYNMGATNEIVNAIPVTDGWAPMPAAAPFSPAVVVFVDENGIPLVDENGNVLVEGADGSPITGLIQLPSPPLGGIFARASDGTTVLVVGTQTGLYRFDFTEYTWIDISRISGGAYDVAVGYRWSFAIYGTTIYAQNYNDAEQMLDIVLDSHFSDNATAPVCAFIAVVGDFLMRGRFKSNPNMAQWSALNDPTANVIGDDFSDVQPFGEGNGITGLVPVSTGAIVFLREAIQTLTFNPNSTYVFVRSAITKYRGTMAPYSVRDIGQDDFVYYAADGFFRGIGQNPIGAERVNRWLLNNTTQAARTEMLSVNDPRNNIVWHRVQIATGDYVLLGYNWLLDRWCKSDIDLVDMFRAETAPITIDGMDALFPTIDDINIPYDSSAWDGGSPEFAGVDSNGRLVFVNGSPMQATILTNEASLNDTSSAFANMGTLDGDAANFSVIASTAEYKGGAFRDRPAVSPSSRTRRIPIRANGRVHRFKVVIPAGEDWSIFSGIDIPAVGSGSS